MSGKRSAEEYITKENGSIFGNGYGEEKPRLATSDQMASRKMATPRGRLNRTGTPQRRFPPSTGMSTPGMNSNPFAGANQQTFGNPGSAVFGAQPTDSMNQASSGFSFSANSGNVNNPFANMNGINGSTGFGANQENDDSREESRAKRVNTGKTDSGSSFSFGASQPQSSGFSFGASQSQNQSQTQQSQNQNSTNPFGGLFGISSQNSSPAQSPAPSFTFGQTNATQQSQTPSFGFGQTSNTQPSQSSSFSFGQSNNVQTTAEQQPAKPAISFGQSSNTQQQSSATPSFSFGQSNIKTQTAAEQQQAKPAFSLGQSTTQSTATEQQAAKPMFSFGQSTAQSTAAEQSPAKSASSIFGQSITQKATEQPAAKPNFSFGLSNAQDTTQKSTAEPSPSKPGFSFGQSTAQSTAEPPAAKPSYSFGQSTTQSTAESPAAKSLFNLSQSTTQGTAESPAPKPAYSFGQNTTQSTAESPASKPAFSFGQSTTESTAEPSVAKPVYSFGQGATKSTAEQSPAKSPFNFGQGATQSTPEQQTPKPTFSFGLPASNSQAQAPIEATKSPAPQQQASSSIFNFAAKSSTVEQQSKSQSALTPAEEKQTSEPAITFGTSPQASSTQQEQAKPAFSFGAPVSSGGLFTPAAPKLAAPAQAQPIASTEDALPSTAPKKNLFGTLSQPAPAAITERSNMATPVTTGPPSLGGTAPIQRQVYTKSPSRIPNFLNGEGFKEYDNNYRLRALNKEFKKKIVGWDADRFDIENLIRHYVSARAAVGGDIGLYQRALAGTKRKSDDSAEEQNVPSQYKKAKFDGSDTSQSTLPPAQSVPKPAVSDAQAKPARVDFAAPTAQPAYPSLPAVESSRPKPAAAPPVAPKSTSSTSLFSNMIPASPSQANETPKATPAKPNNPFSGVPLMDDGNQSFSWGNTINAGATPKAPSKFFSQSFGSTTPQKSPPKNGLFGMSSTTPSSGLGKKRSLDIAEQDDDEQGSSEDESRKKRSKLNSKQTPNIFGNHAATTKKSNGPFEEDSTDEADEDTDAQTGDDQQDSDFAPNADGTDSNGSEADEYAEESDDIAGVTQQEESETSRASDEDHSQEIEANPNKGKSLFDRIEKPQNKPEESTPPAQSAAPAPSASTIKWPALGANSTASPAAPAFSPITPATVSPYKPAKTFEFTPTQASRPAVESNSVLAGGPTTGAFAKFDGMFGSRPSTPEPEKPKTANAPTSAPSNDFTWKQDTPIKFGLVPPSPQPEKASTPAAGLFGKTPTTQTDNAATGSLGFGFGKSLQPSYLQSVASSAISSRATSPGLTDNESVATNDTTDEAQNDPQQNLMDSRPGEENETVLFEVKAKALLMANKKRAEELKIDADYWSSIGVGMLRILKNEQTGKARVVLRAEPNANVVINSNLYPSIDYDVRDQGKKSGAVNARFDYKGGFDHIVLKVKTAELAQQLSEVLNQAKTG